MKTSQVAPHKIGFLFGRGRNTRRDPHHVLRPGGTDVWILEYTVSGRGFVRSGGLVTSMGPGELLLFPPGLAQDYGMDPEHGAWDHLWVCFAPPAPWLELLKWPEGAQGLPRLALPPALRPRVKRALEEGVRLFHEPLERRHAFAMNRLEEVLLWCETANPDRAQGRMDPRIRRALEFIHRQATRPLSLAELAHCAVLSPPRFSHLFKEQTGRSPWHFIEDRRLAHAVELLLMSGKTVAEVGRESGFSSPFYFSRTFKRRYGMGPRAFRGKTPRS